MIDIVCSKLKKYNEDLDYELYLYDNEYGTSDYYKNRTEPTDTSNLGFYILNDEKLLGGAVVYQAWDWLFVDTVVIKKMYRKKGLGTQLFRKIEEYAKSKDLVGIKLATLYFQAKEFYEKMGFQVLCMIENCPRGNTKYELVKYL